MRISDWSSDVCSSDLTRPKSRSQAPISSRRTVRTRLARRLRRLSGDCAQHNPEPAHFLRSEQTTDAATPITRARSEEHTSELQSLMRISYAVFCLKKTKQSRNHSTYHRLQKNPPQQIS